ncbi:uncharacterized protein LOC117647269 isoform X2 [Thrips palmi]|uniref:histone acetyltransferase n=1 Tax=Thrips palmi TaxID=161013 RepID=A0A6P8YXI2_THRPL|nr:uncharacterized protein LOC117647269 isoform X2 [Thrips palmi]
MELLYSPTSSNSTDAPPRKADIMSRYMSQGFKTARLLKTAAVKTVSLPPESMSSSHNPSHGTDVLSKYAKSGEPSLFEIFGASPESGNMDVTTAQVDEIEVTGEGEQSKEPPSWIDAGHPEGKGASHPSRSDGAKWFGVPDMGFADILSESAALPLPAFPMSGGPIIEGASHDESSITTKPPSKGLAPQKKKLIQQHLILLLHAYKCERAVVTKLPCPVPFCSVMKKVQAHMRMCTDGYTCVAPFCSSSRRIMCHWKHCKTPDCVVCSRLKCIAMHKRQRELEKMKAMGQIQKQTVKQVPEVIVIDGPESPQEVKPGNPTQNVV